MASSRWEFDPMAYLKSDRGRFDYLSGPKPTSASKVGPSTTKEKKVSAMKFVVTVHCRGTLWGYRDLEIEAASADEASAAALAQARDGKFFVICEDHRTSTDWHLDTAEVMELEEADDSWQHVSEPLARITGKLGDLDP
jgi:hypothetical protein